MHLLYLCVKSSYSVLTENNMRFYEILFLPRGGICHTGSECKVIETVLVLKYQKKNQPALRQSEFTTGGNKQLDIACYEKQRSYSQTAETPVTDIIKQRDLFLL